MECLGSNEIKIRLKGFTVENSVELGKPLRCRFLENLMSEHNATGQEKPKLPNIIISWRNNQKSYILSS